VGALIRAEPGHAIRRSPRAAARSRRWPDRPVRNPRG
jgi:hypothetical protein